MTLQEATLSLDGLELHYYVAGEPDAPALVLLHGGGTDSAMLSWKLVHPLVAQTHRVYLPDWPGYGGSPPLPGGSTHAALLSCLEALVDAWGFDRASLVGVSMGGGLALGFTLEHPERLDRLVLVDSYALQETAPAHKLSYLYIRLPFLVRLTWALTRASRALARQALKSIFFDPNLITPELVDEVFAAVRSPGVGQAFYSFQRSELHWGGLRTCYLDRLGELRLPTLLVHGNNDTLVPLKYARRAANLIPGARLHIIPSCGHWPQREKPEEFNQALGEFLNAAV